jgi:hypothetical protein
VRLSPPVPELLVAALLKNREVDPDELDAIEKLIEEWKRREKK